MVVIALLVMSSPLPSVAAGTDDLFGMYYDGGYVPSGTIGIQVSYSISTTGLSCSSSSGWVSAIDSVRTNGGSPDEWWLQMGVAFSCGQYPSAPQWIISTQVWNSSGKIDPNCPPTCSDIQTLSTSTYPSLSGTISIYYRGSAWVLNTYVSQTGSNYSPSTSSAIQGTSVDGSAGANDWTNVETDQYQTGLSYTSSFSWSITSPEYYVTGGWEAWNSGSSGSCALKSYVAFQPQDSSTNELAVKKISNNGVSVYYYGSNPPNNNGNTLSWSIASTFYLTMTVTGSGSVSPSSGNKNCDSGVSISASPGTGYNFCYWTGSGSGSYAGSGNQETVTMNAAISENAVFRINCPMNPTG